MRIVYEINMIFLSCDELLEIFLFCALDIGLGLNLPCSEHFPLLSTSRLLDLSLELLL